MRFTQILADKKAQITADWGYGVQFLDLVLVLGKPFHHSTFPPFHF